MTASFHSVTFSQRGINPTIIVNTRQAQAELSLFGAHLLSFKTRHHNRIDTPDLLWCSDKAIYDCLAPIRGGVPICWPWFADLGPSNSKTAHGLVRNQMWKLVSVDEDIVDNEIEKTSVVLTPSVYSSEFLPRGVELQLSIEITDTCKLTMTTLNNSHRDIEISQALHSYFNIGDIKKAEIKGISADFFDKPSGKSACKLHLPYTISGEIDRIHIAELDDNHQQSIDIQFGSEYSINVINEGHDSIVVWNPGSLKSAAMKDMHDNAYASMLCIEAANTKATLVKMGEAKQISQQIGLSF